MPKPHYMPIEVKEWLSSRRVQRMGFAARGAALQLMIEMWNEDDCSLPDDDEDLADRLGITVAKWRKLKAILTDPKKGFFLIENESLFSEKLSVLYEKASKTSAKRSEAGKVGGQKSAALRSKSEAGLEPGLSGAEASHSHNQTSEAKTESSSPDGDGDGDKSDYPKDFATFWDAYPRKVSKIAALKVWKGLRHRPPVAELVEAVTRQARSARWQDKTFIPHPDKWLKDGRWLDEPDVAPTTNEPDPRVLFIQATREKIAERLRWIDGHKDDPRVPIVKAGIAELEAKLQCAN